MWNRAFGALQAACQLAYSTQRALTTGRRTLEQKLALLPDAAHPTKKVEGNKVKWLRPFFSLRQLAEMKKEASKSGLKWPLDDGSAANKKSFYETRILKCKGHKYERLKPTRDAEIAGKIAAMPKAVGAWREERRKARTKTELQKILSGPTKYGGG